MNIRLAKVSKLIQKEVATILQRDFYESTQSMVTITDVRMTPDLSIAYINVSILGSDEDKQVSLKRLKLLAPEIRHELASHIRHQLRSVPELRFFLDESLEQTAKMESLFDKIREERASRGIED